MCNKAIATPEVLFLSKNTSLHSAFHVFKGVAASNKMASNDLKAMNRYKDDILQVAKEKNIDPAVIAGQAEDPVALLLLAKHFKQFWTKIV